MSITDERLAELIESSDFMARLQSSPIQMARCADTAAALGELQQLRKLMPAGKCPDCRYPIDYLAQQKG